MHLHPVLAVPSVRGRVDTRTCDRACEIQAGTVVDLEIAEALSSAKQKRGDKFAIRLRRSIDANGIELVPAGTEGVGEIVHAERARGGGKPGELLIAARYLEHGGSQLRLRALKFGASGVDHSNLALGASLALGPLALFIHGAEHRNPCRHRGECKDR